MVHKGGSIACVVREGVREGTGESAKGARADERGIEPPCWADGRGDHSGSVVREVQA